MGSKEDTTSFSNVLGLKFLDRKKPADLSGGQRQRVAMGRDKSILDGRTFVKRIWLRVCINEMRIHLVSELQHDQASDDNADRYHVSY